MDLKSLLVSIATIAGILCTFATLFLYGFSRIGDGGNGRSESIMIGTAVAAVAFYGAAAYIATQNLTIG